MIDHTKKNRGWMSGWSIIWAPLSGGAVAPPLLRLAPIYQEPNTSKKHPQHKIWPYLLRNMVIDREL